MIREQRFGRITEDGFDYCCFPIKGEAGSRLAESWTMRARTCRTAVEAKMPAAHAEIVFNLGPTGRHLTAPDLTAPATAPRAAWVIGPHAGVLHIAKEIADSDVIGIRLRADAIPAVLGVPAAELQGRMPDLEAFWGADGVDRVRARLGSTADPVARAAIVGSAIPAFGGAPDADGRLIHAVCRTIATRPGASIGEIAAGHGLTHRRLIMLFDRYVGLKPKQFQQVRRLGRVMSRVDVSSGSLSRVAFELGYADQAHLANEFRRFTGLTITGYVATRSPVGVGFVRHHLARPVGDRRPEAFSSP